jgi:hypothetical protein
MQTVAVMSCRIILFLRRLYSVSKANCSFNVINSKAGRNLRSSGNLRIAEWNSLPTFWNNLFDPWRWVRPRRKHLSFIWQRKPEITNNMSYWARIASHFKLNNFFKIYVLKTRAWISLTSPVSLVKSKHIHFDHAPCTWCAIHQNNQCVCAANNASFDYNVAKC